MPEPSPTNPASAPQDSPSPTHSRDPFRCTVKRSSQQPTNSSPDSQQHRAGMSTLDTQRASERPHRTVIASGQVTTIVADRLPEPKPELLHKRPVIMDASPQAACVPNLNHATRVGSGKRPAPSPDRSSFDIFPNDVVAANAAAASPQHHRGEGRAGSITGNTKRAPSHTTVTYEAQIQRRVQKESEQLGFGHKVSSTRDPHYQVQAPFARDGDE